VEGPQKQQQSADSAIEYLEEFDMGKERSGERPGATTSNGGLSVRWDDSNMRSIYSNVCNVTGTREEIVLLFGVNQAWQSGVKEVTVQLQDRIILSPYAAKRLNLLLSRALAVYESQYGPLNVEVAGQSGPAEQLPTA
jgi:Protein of unknown function (DUF3467)